MANIKDFLNKIKTAVYGWEVRGSLADGLDAVNKETEAATELTGETKQRQDSLEQQFNDEIANMSLEDPSSAEIVAGRTNTETGSNYPTIGERLDAEHNQVTSQLADLSQSKTDKITSDADRAYFENKFKALMDGSPSGAFDSLDALKEAYPDGIDGIYVVREDGSWYFWMEGSGWTSGGPYQRMNISDRSITPARTTFINPGANTFDKNKITRNKYVNFSNGNLEDHDTHAASPIIRIKPGTTYTPYKFMNVHFAFRDINLNFIPTETNSLSYPFISPANAYYVQLTLETEDDAVEAMLTEGVGKPGKYLLYEDKLDKVHVPKLAPSDIFSDYEQTRNLFDKNSAISGKYVSWDTGDVLENEAYYASDFIPVDPGTEYTRSYSHMMAFYDDMYRYMSGINGAASTATQVTTFTTPENCHYIRVTVGKEYLESIMLNEGTNVFDYESYGYKLKGLQGNEQKDDFLLFLPHEICVAKGRTIELYNSQVAWTGNLNNFHFNWNCEIGFNLKRKMKLVGNNVGEYALAVTIYDNNMRQVAHGSSTVKVVDNVLPASKTILTIGDSLTNTAATDKPHWAEVRTLSDNKIGFIGTRGLADSLKHEGRSGWSAQRYLTGDEYEYEGEGSTPFWDGYRFNWDYYKTNTGLNPDAVNIWLGINGIQLNPDANARAIKQIVDYIRQDDIDLPIFVTFTPYRANQNGIGVQTGSDGYAVNRGAWELEEKRKVFNLMTSLYDLLNSYSNLFFIPVALEHDSEYNFGSVETPVNPRATQTELMPIEATHPQEQGYLQIADIMFSCFAAHLGE